MCNLSDYVEELGIQKGLEQGKERLLRLQIEKKLAKGLSLPEIADALEEKEDTIRKMIGAIKHTTEQQNEKNKLVSEVLENKLVL